MKTVKAFLEARSTAPPFNERLAVFVREYERYRRARARPLRLLDVGCGENAVLADFVHPDDVYHGCDYRQVTDARAHRFTRVDLNEERLSEVLKGEQFDVIWCGEVIEHLFSPDSLLDEIRELMHGESVLILSTPNLGYWVNRVLLMLGISPLFLENSAEQKLGRRWRRLGQGNPTEGHIRLFTYTALRDLVHTRGFEIVRTIPAYHWNFFLDRIVCRVSRSLAPINVFVLRTRGS